MLRGGTVVADEDLAVGPVWETRFHASSIKQSGPLSPTNDAEGPDRGNPELGALHVFGPVDGAKPFDCVDALGIDSGPAALLARCRSH